MQEDQKEASGVSTLKTIRLEKRLSIDDLSGELKISKKFILALEEGDYDALPGPTYVKGYIRAYSRSLGIDPDLVLQSYDVYLNPKKETSKTVKKAQGFNLFSLFLKNRLWALIVFIILLIIILLASNRESKEADNREKVELDYLLNSTSNINSSSIIKAKSLEVKEDTEILSDLIVNQPLVEEQPQLIIKNKIKINFIKESWIEVSDQNKSIEYNLKEAGSYLEFDELLPLKILIGNVMNVELFLNEEKIDLLKSYNKETNVGCVVLPSGLCNEFINPR